MLLHSERLNGLEINIAQAALAIAAQVEKQLQRDCLLIFGYRSVEAQNALYAQGRTAPGNIVTQAAGGQSAHNYNCAFDLCVMMPGNKECDWNNIYINAIFKIVAEANPLLLWGGDYTGGWKDYDHIEFKNWISVSNGLLKIVTYHHQSHENRPHLFDTNYCYSILKMIMQINWGNTSGTGLIKNGLIIALLIYCIFLRECSPSPQTATIKGKDSVSYCYTDTGTTRLIPGPIQYRDTGTFKIVPKYIIKDLTKAQGDSILKAYSIPYLFVQTFTAKNYKARFQGVINYDSLYNTKLDIDYFGATEIVNNTTVTNPVRNMVFIGCGIGGGINSFNLSPTLSLLTKKYHLYALSSNVAISEPNVLFTMGFKVHF